MTHRWADLWKPKSENWIWYITKSQFLYIW